MLLSTLLEHSGFTSLRVKGLVDSVSDSVDLRRAYH